MLTMAMKGGGDTSATERGKRGAQTMDEQVSKEPGRRTGAEQDRAKRRGGRQEKLEGRAAARQVEEVHHCWRGEGRLVGAEGETDDKL